MARAATAVENQPPGLGPIHENRILSLNQDDVSPAMLRSSSVPYVHHATASRVVKGEDVMFVHPLDINTQPQSMMYMVCDGHGGVEAANFVASNFLRILNTKLPSSLPNFGQVKDVETFSENVRKAVCETFVRLDNEWTNVGHLSGTTVTVALAMGWLLTVANTGDSASVLDTGCSILELTKSHRIQSNQEEQDRLRAAHQHLAPLGFHLQGPARPNEPGVGPLRIWPGGLCVSRSIGDLDAGPEVVPVPHIRQVIIPPEGCRVIMASDGLWDVLTFTKAVKLTRSKLTGAAASALVGALSRDQRINDDTSIVVVDLLPSEGTSFPTVALKANPKGSSTGGGGLFACFKPEPVEEDSRDAMGRGHLDFFCDVDCMRAYPGLKQVLNRASVVHAALGFASPLGASRVPDYTLHGGHVYSAAAVAAASCSPAGVHPNIGLYAMDTGADGTNHSARSVQSAQSHVDSMPAAAAVLHAKPGSNGTQLEKCKQDGIVVGAQHHHVVAVGSAREA